MYKLYEFWSCSSNTEEDSTVHFPLMNTTCEYLFWVVHLSYHFLIWYLPADEEVRVIYDTMLVQLCERYSNRLQLIVQPWSPVNYWWEQYMYLFELDFQFSTQEQCCYKQLLSLTISQKNTTLYGDYSLVVWSSCLAVWDGSHYRWPVHVVGKHACTLK